MTGLSRWIEPFEHVDDLRMWENDSQLRPPSRLTSTDRSRSILFEVNHQLESRMRETRSSGSEGGGTQTNESSLPLSRATPGSLGGEVARLVEIDVRCRLFEASGTRGTRVHGLSPMAPRCRRFAAEETRTRASQ